MEEELTVEQKEPITNAPSVSLERLGEVGAQLRAACRFIIMPEDKS